MSSKKKEKNDNNETYVVVATMFWLGLAIIICSALLWGFSIISTRLFIAFAIIGILFLFISLYFITVDVIITKLCKEKK